MTVTESYMAEAKVNIKKTDNSSEPPKSKGSNGAGKSQSEIVVPKNGKDTVQVGQNDDRTKVTIDVSVSGGNTKQSESGSSDSTKPTVGKDGSKNTGNAKSNTSKSSGDPSANIKPENPYTENTPGIGEETAQTDKPETDQIESDAPAPTSNNISTPNATTVPIQDSTTAPSATPADNSIAPSPSPAGAALSATSPEPASMANPKQTSADNTSNTTTPIQQEVVPEKPATAPTKNQAKTNPPPVTDFNQPAPLSSQSQIGASPEENESGEPGTPDGKTQPKPNMDAAGAPTPNVDAPPADGLPLVSNENSGPMPAGAPTELSKDTQTGAAADLAKSQNRTRRASVQNSGGSQSEPASPATAANAQPKTYDAPQTPGLDEYGRPEGGSPPTAGDQNQQQAAGGIAKNRQQQIKQLETEKKELADTVKNLEHEVNHILKPPRFQFGFPLAFSWPILIAKIMLRMAIQTILRNITKGKGQAKLVVLKTANTVLGFLITSLTIVKKMAATVEGFKMWGQAIAATSETIIIPLILIILLPVFLLFAVVLDLGQMPRNIKQSIKKIKNLRDKFAKAIQEEEKKINARKRLRQVEKELKILRRQEKISGAIRGAAGKIKSGITAPFRSAGKNGANLANTPNINSPSVK